MELFHFHILIGTSNLLPRASRFALRRTMLRLHEGFRAVIIVFIFMRIP
jgi:hypothetical protein